VGDAAVTDYAAIEGSLTAQRTARIIPADLLAAVERHPYFDASDKRRALAHLRQFPEERTTIHAMLLDGEAQYQRETEMIHDFFVRVD
jgi:hypothetical protein